MSACARALRLLLLALAGVGAAGACGNASVALKLSSVLLAEYERDVRPQQAAAAAGQASAQAGQASPTPVAVELFVRHARIDETKATAIIVADLFMAWADWRLAWNTTDWGLEAMYVDAAELWRPDVALLNAAETLAMEEPARVALSSDGAAMWVPRVELAAPCELALDAWPRDEHECSFEFGSRLYTKDAIQYLFHSYKKGDMEEQEAGAWAASITGSSLLSERREGGEFAAVRWDVNIRRRGDAHAVVAGAVTWTLVSLHFSAMLLPAASRAPLHAAAALAACAHLTAAALRLPPAGSAPRVLRLHAALLALAGAGAVMAAVVARVAGLAARTPPPLRRLLLRTSFVSGYREQKEDSESDVGGAGRGVCEWTAAARLLDTVLFAVCTLVALVLLILYL